MIQIAARTTTSRQGRTSHIYISFIDRVRAGVGLGGDIIQVILSQKFLKTTTTRVDLQAGVASDAAAQGQSVVNVVVYIENAKARCDVVFTIWFDVPVEIEDHFKSFL